MAAHDLGIPQITVLDIHGDTSSSPIYNSSFPTIGPPMRGDRSPPSDVHDTHPLLSLVLTNYPTHSDVPDSPPSLTSNASPSHPPPSPTQSAHSSVRITSAGSPDINAEEHDHLSSSGLLAPPTRGVSIIGASRKINSSSTLRQLISVSPCHFGVLVTTPSPANTHADARSDTSLPSSVAGSYNGIVRVQKEENAGVRPDSAGTDLNVDSFAFKPLLLSLIDPKSLENLEGSGGVEGLLHGFGTDRLHGPSTNKRLRQFGSPDPDPGIRGINNAITPPLDQIRKSRFERMSRWTLRYFCQCKRGRLMLHTPPPSRALAASPTAHVKVAEFNPSRINSPLIVYPFRQLELALMTTSPTVPTSPGGAFGVDRFVSLKAIIENRQRVYGHSIIPHRPSKRLVLLMWLALHAKVLALLSVAIISLTLRIFLDFRTTRPEGDPSVWTDGVAIVVSILVVVIVGSLNEWQKEKQSKVPSEKNKDRLVTVIRDGRERQIHAHEIAVGDVVLFEPGEVIPCDGVFFSGHNVFCDESGATGESDAIKKLFDQECTALKDNRPMELDASGSPGDGESPSGLELLGHADCFIASGSNVLDGSYVVTSVGIKSFNGHIVMALSNDSENTPWQLKLNDLAEAIAKVGSVAGGLLFVALLVRYFFELGTNDLQSASGEMGVALINILNMAVTLVVVAHPKGLPLVATLTLAFATKQMSKENLLVRVLGSCETMANATVICTNKTGTLTQNEMTVVAGTVGVHAKFIRRLEECRERTGSEVQSNSNTKDFHIDLANLNTVLPCPLKDLFNAAIAINSTAFEDVDDKSGVPVFIGSKTELALLGFANELGWPNYKNTHASVDIVHIIPFSSYRKSMGCVVRVPGGSHRLYVKGASEILAGNCTRHVVLGNAAPSTNRVETAPIGELEEDHISLTITLYASQALRTIALCYRDFPSWPPKGARILDKDEIDYDVLMTDLTLISIIGIEDPTREGMREAVANCGKAGVRVKMCTGDNVLTAKSIAEQCGIYTAGGIVMEGPHFRALSPDVMKTIVPRLQVLARSSPEDKRMLVETLKELGDVVGVTGGSTDDGPALRTANVGFSMGISGAEVAKEASDIVLMDDAFPSIVNAIMWGRCVNDSVRKFLQFMISGNVTAIVTTFVWVLASSSSSLWSAVQLLWVNLIMDAFAALTLATDPAFPAQLASKPDKKTDLLFTVDMTKQILGQAIYQITMILIFHFLGSKVLGFHPTDDSSLQKHHDGVVQTLIFNAFVFAQIFNSLNCRRLDRKLNIFEDMTRNWYFMAITTTEVAVQVLICFFGGSAFGVTRMGAREWAISLALGCVPLPLGALIRLIPNEPCERAFEKLQLLPTPELLPMTRLDVQPGSSFGMDHVRANSDPSTELRRDCVHGPSQVRKRHCRFPDTDATRHALATVPSPDASHTAAPDWQWRSRAPHSDPGFHPATSSTTLWDNVFEVHPDTPRDDPVYGLLGMTP